MRTLSFMRDICMEDLLTGERVGKSDLNTYKNIIFAYEKGDSYPGEKVRPRIWYPPYQYIQKFGSNYEIICNNEVSLLDHLALGGNRPKMNDRQLYMTLDMLYRGFLEYDFNNHEIKSYYPGIKSINANCTTFDFFGEKNITLDEYIKYTYDVNIEVDTIFAKIGEHFRKIPNKTDYEKVSITINGKTLEFDYRYFIVPVEDKICGDIKYFDQFTLKSLKQINQILEQHLNKR